MPVRIDAGVSGFQSIAVTVSAGRGRRAIGVLPAPVTPAPVTPAPVTPAPVNTAPVTSAPVTPAG
jgi:hypothetical protein